MDNRVQASVEDFDNVLNYLNEDIFIESVIENIIRGFYYLTEAFGLYNLYFIVSVRHILD